MKFWILSFGLILCFQLKAQEALEDLSAKERFAIAENEKIEAATDVTFQQFMSEGHEYFSNKHYLKAIRSYEKAAEQRPYNVYPKVKISDIELSMKDTLEILREAEKKEQEKPTEVKKPLPEPELVEEKLPESMEETVDRLDEWEERERRKREAERNREKETPVQPVIVDGDVPQMSMDEYRKELGNSYPNGVTETVTTEGNKTITTRIVVKDGKGDEYKKVEHNWGGIFFFKNGDAVTERVWNQEATSK
jgi:hypothetical protein